MLPRTLSHKLHRKSKKDSHLMAGVSSRKIHLQVFTDAITNTQLKAK